VLYKVTVIQMSSLFWQNEVVSILPLFVVLRSLWQTDMASDVTTWGLLKDQF